MKERKTTAPVFTLPNVNKLFKVDYDASRITTRTILSQEICPLAFSSEKLSEAKQKCSIYEQELYAIVRNLQ